MEERLILYILGELSEQDQIELESEYFGDEEKYKLLQSVQADLMDAYFKDKLPQKQRQLFEKNILNSPSQHKNLNFSQLLVEYLSRKEWSES